MQLSHRCNAHRYRQKLEKVVGGGGGGSDPVATVDFPAFDHATADPEEGAVVFRRGCVHVSSSTVPCCCSMLLLHGAARLTRLAQHAIVKGRGAGQAHVYTCTRYAC